MNIFHTNQKYTYHWVGLYTSYRNLLLTWIGKRNRLSLTIGNPDEIQKRKPHYEPTLITIKAILSKQKSEKNKYINISERLFGLPFTTVY